MTGWDVIAVLAAIALFMAWLAWLGRHPCNHPEWVDLGEGAAVCTSCDEVFQLEER